MRFRYGRFRSHALGLVVFGAMVIAAPATAQWSQVADIPATVMFSVSANGDTIAAGADSTVYASTNAGLTWRRSTKPVSGVTSIQAVLVRDGRLYAGTFGQGVHVSDDLGTTWHSFNEGLVGGILDSQLFLTDLQPRGDSLYAATAGAGVYVRNLAGSGAWQPSGAEVFESNQAANVDGLALGGSRLLAMASQNGMVFRNDSGETDWTTSNLDNVGLHPALIAQSAVFTGTGWVVGSNLGIFRSVAGQEPWARFDPGLGPLSWTAFATQGGHLFAAFDTPLAAVMAESGDDGATWETVETQGGVFVQKLAITGNALYAARGDGLWRRPITVTSVGVDGGPGALRFAIAGPQPFGSGTRLRFELPRSETISIELFDVHGRLVGDRIEGPRSSGRHEVALNAQSLASGVYMARLTAGGKRQVVRLVHVR